jgi:predicted transcriptional regulator
MKESKLSRTSQLTRLVPRNKVAFYLGVCTRTIKRYEEGGKLTPHVINSRLTAYPESEVLELISNARQVAAPIA